MFKFFLIPLLILFFSIQFYFLNFRTQSFGFADENEHLVPAQLIADKGLQLYSSISTNHQPLPIFTGTMILEIFNPTNLFMTIERTRQTMLGLSLLGAIVMILRFGYRGFAAATIIEITKFYFLGYHLLAESLIVYPIIYLGGLFLSTNDSFLDDIVVGFSIFWIVFNLLPAWPFCICYLFLHFQRKKFRIKPILRTIFSMAIPVLALLIFINIEDWFSQTVRNNFIFFIPFEKNLRLEEFPKLLFFPFTGIGNLKEVIVRQYIFLVIPLMLFSYRHFFKAVIIYFLFVILNTRVFSTDVSFAGAFHLLPQISFLVSVAMFVKIHLKVRTVVYLLAIISAMPWWLESPKFNKKSENYVNYSQDESIGLAIKSVALNKDRTLAGPQGGFSLIASRTLPATSLVSYLPWAYYVPKNKSDFENIYENLPEFIYFSKSNNPFYLDLKPILESQYIAIVRNDGRVTDLYISKQKIAKVTNLQWENFSALSYLPPITN